MQGWLNDGSLLRRVWGSAICEKILETLDSIEKDFLKQLNSGEID